MKRLATDCKKIFANLTKGFYPEYITKYQNSAVKKIQFKSGQSNCTDTPLEKTDE